MDALAGYGDLSVTNWAEISGYVASCLVFLTFCMKTLIPLRLVAILSNIAFIGYSAVSGLLPVLLLHSLLLPLNILRAIQQFQTLRHVRKAALGQPDVTALLAFMRRRTIKDGTVVFRKGDISREIYFLGSGQMLIPEIGKRLEAGTLFGEMGIFVPDRTRTASAICVGDCEVFAMDEDDIVRLCLDNPVFGLYLTKLITGRMIENQERSEQSQHVEAIRRGA